ncbi:hypothetical protein BG015_003219 [Linnemannia schmuckeri]|uniref:FAD-binding domain-containing protein n=1 Tax=Linnemannia schmuckeri TaxID=64567 RepID=A0A9P5RLW7_9FUNG|nr:hypothetical protein BG015_003219 [Linnemannia schmuckeri]
MSLSPNILPAFEQIGLYEELMSFSKSFKNSSYYTGQLKVIARDEGIPADAVGYDRIQFARPELYDMLFKQIPPEKMHMSKKILSFQQNHEGVMLRFSDNTTTHGDILVGADGAHSAVRQHLYQTLDKQGLLPKADTKAMSRGYISLVGTTEALDPEKYPGVLKKDCDINFIIGDKNTPYTVSSYLDLDMSRGTTCMDFNRKPKWTTFTVPGNKICWNVIIQIGIAELADDQFRTSDWIEKVSKVYFEDMLFETWNHGRTILIGDDECSGGVHYSQIGEDNHVNQYNIHSASLLQLLPSTGAGAVNAMQDAVLLANHLYDIKPTSFENIQKALSDYKNERFEAVKEQYPQSYMAAKLMYGHTFSERILRQIVFNWLPKSTMQKQLQKNTAYRPQANFLPQAPKRGT